METTSRRMMGSCRGRRPVSLTNFRICLRHYPANYTMTEPCRFPIVSRLKYLDNDLSMSLISLFIASTYHRRHDLLGFCSSSSLTLKRRREREKRITSDCFFDTEYLIEILSSSKDDYRCLFHSNLKRTLPR